MTRPSTWSGWATSAGGLHHAEAAVGRAELPGGDRSVLADALAVAVMVSFLNGDGLATERLDRALRLEDPDRRRLAFTSPRLIAGLLLMWTGQVREAVETLVALRAERRERGVESDVPTSSLYLAWAYLWLGETDRAAEIAASDTAAVALLGDPGITALALSAAALVSAQRGDLKATRAQAGAALARFAELEWWTGTVFPRWALGIRRAVGGRSGGRPRRAGAAHRDAAVDGTGRPDRARLPSGRDRGAHRPRGAGPGTAVHRAPAAAGSDRTTGRGRSPPRRAVVASWPPRAAIWTRRSPRSTRRWPPTTASKCRSSADAPCSLSAGRGGGASSGRPHASRCATRWRSFVQTGAPLWADAARNELGRAGERTSDPSELTATERLIAELAASGLSNQEVAERAFLTVKGVEANLTRAYRKLGHPLPGRAAGRAAARRRGGHRSLTPDVPDPAPGARSRHRTPRPRARAPPPARSYDHPVFWS